MALFINNCLLNDERILSSKITNNKPRYIICDCFGGKIGTSNRTFDEVKYYLDMGYLPQDIFILAPSIKTDKSPVRQLENKIKRELTHIQVYVPTSEDEKLDNEISRIWINPRLFPRQHVNIPNKSSLNIAIPKADTPTVNAIPNWS